MGAIISLLFVLVYLGVVVLMIAGFWKTFEKAGKPGWACLVPIYSLIVWLEIAGKPASRLLYYLIPFAGIYFMIVDTVDFAKAFGKSDTGFIAGLILLPFVFYPKLGFGDARYQGSATPQAAGFPVGLAH